MIGFSRRGALSVFTLTLLTTTGAVWAADPGRLPGDRGRPFDGLLPAPGAATGPAKSAPPPAPPPHIAGPPLALALQAAEAIVRACPQYPLAVAVTNAAGVPNLIYVPDGSEQWHGYSAVRKAYTAVTFGADSSVVMQTARNDARVADRVRSDPNLQAFVGALVIRRGDQVIGALSVSGAEPGGHDEECARAGLAVLNASVDAPAQSGAPSRRPE